MSFEDMLGEDERELSELSELLSAAKPAAGEGWQGRLGRELEALRMPMSGAKLWPLVALLTLIGLAALCVVILGVLGHGPFAAG